MFSSQHICEYQVHTSEWRGVKVIDSIKGECSGRAYKKLSIC